jgi:hypothetical protein
MRRPGSLERGFFFLSCALVKSSFFLTPLPPSGALPYEFTGPQQRPFVPKRGATWGSLRNRKTKNIRGNPDPEEDTLPIKVTLVSAEQEAHVPLRSWTFGR